MRSNTTSPRLHDIRESITKSLKARILKSEWSGPAVGCLCLDDQGHIISDLHLATGSECHHVSASTPLKAALLEQAETVLVWHFQVSRSSTEELAFHEFIHTLHYGCLDFGIRLWVLPIVMGTP